MATMRPFQGTWVVRGGQRCREWRPCHGLTLSTTTSRVCWGLGLVICHDLTSREVEVMLGYRTIALHLAGGMGYRSGPWPPTMP